MVLIFSASPNKNGLTDACCRAAITGIEKAGGQYEYIDLSAMKIRSCQICNDGWGPCRNEHYCVIDDGLSQLQQKMDQADSVMLITPVYWWQPCERMQFFLSRVRRCEAKKPDKGVVTEKKVNMVAAAGGSGNGLPQALLEMENWCRHMGAIPHERIGINRFNRESMLGVIELVAGNLVVPQ